MSEGEPKYRPIIDRKQWDRGVEYIKEQRDQATTPIETLQAFALYGKLVGVHALVGISALADRIIQRPDEQPPNEPPNVSDNNS